MTMNSTPKIDFSRPLDYGTVKGRTALVTGGASGMGLGTVQALAENGAYVAIVDLNDEAGKAAERELNDKGYNVIFIKSNVTSWASQSEAFKSTLEFSPNSSIDIVIPSAGITGDYLSQSATPDDLPAGQDLPKPPTACLEINSTAVYFTTNLALHYFKNHPGKSAQHKKHILFVSSLAGYGSIPLYATYVMSKWAVRGLWKSLVGLGNDSRFGSAGVRFNLIAPTYIRTPMTQLAIDVLESRGNIIGEISDAVAGIMRILCDESIESRAVAIAGRADKSMEPGATNFDLCDDPEGMESARELLGNVRSGTFGGAFGNLFGSHKG